MQSPHCESCGEPEHDYDIVEETARTCVPPRSVLRFGSVRISRRYREALFTAFPHYTADQIVESCSGRNPSARSEDAWLQAADDAVSTCDWPTEAEMEVILERCREIEEVRPASARDGGNGGDGERWSGWDLTDGGAPASCDI